MNIEFKNGSWYARLIAPKDIRDTLGKNQFLQKLSAKTEKKASQEASPFIARWKKEIALARDISKSNSNSPLLDLLKQALEIQKQLKNSPNDENNSAEYEGILHGLDQMVEDLQNPKNPKTPKLSKEQTSEFYKVAIGATTPMSTYFDDWVAYLVKEKYEGKTIDTYKRDATLFIEKFKAIEAVNKKSVKSWIQELISEGMSLNTAKNRVIKGVRSFWTYLIDQGVAEDDESLLLKVTPRERKTKSATLVKTWTALAPEEVVHILKKVPAKDSQLSTLITIGMYTGCRIEEICSLKALDVKDIEGISCLSISDSKTKAGYRKIPIHSKLKPLIGKLLEDAKDKQDTIPKDAYLIEGLTLNKYGDRSNAIGKRFGRLKTSLGFDEQRVFHSIRKCVVTQLERAGIAENTVADLIGHDKPNETFGTYSDGHIALTLQKVVELLNYEPKVSEAT